ncbi:MAG TPA: CDGSH iron-sulfur domain-containing protein [Actinomycetota bacterium]
MAEPQTPFVEVTEDGPYVLQGDLPLVRTSQVETEYGEPVAWAPDEPVEHGDVVHLCRCGLSATKPFCDGTETEAGFDGREVADRRTYEERRYPYEGDGLTLEDDVSLCTMAGYCGDRFENVWAMIGRSKDPEVRERIRTMSALCPSGRIRTRLPGAEPDEPVHAPSVAVVADGPLWVRGGVPVVASDGTPYEVRNRQTLCRCGASRNKPFCDGSHKRVGFSDG